MRSCHVLVGLVYAVRAAAVVLNRQDGGSSLFARQDYNFPPQCDYICNPVLGALSACGSDPNCLCDNQLLSGGAACLSCSASVPGATQGDITDAKTTLSEWEYNCNNGGYPVHQYTVSTIGAPSTAKVAASTKAQLPPNPPPSPNPPPPPHPPFATNPPPPSNPSPNPTEAPPPFVAPTETPGPDTVSQFDDPAASQSDPGNSTPDLAGTVSSNPKSDSSPSPSLAGSAPVTISIPTTSGASGQPAPTATQSLTGGATTSGGQRSSLDLSSPLLLLGSFALAFAIGR